MPHVAEQRQEGRPTLPWKRLKPGDGKKAHQTRMFYPAKNLSEIKMKSKTVFVLFPLLDYDAPEGRAHGSAPRQGMYAIWTYYWRSLIFSLGLGPQWPYLSSGLGSHVGSSLLVGDWVESGLSWGRPMWRGQWPFRGSPY